MKMSKDLSNCGPIQTLELLSNKATHIYSTGNEISDETILVTTSDNTIEIYCLTAKKVNRSEDEDDRQNSKPVFELNHIQKVQLVDDQINAFAISSECSIYLPPKRLAYAVASSSTGTVFVYLGDESKIPPTVMLEGISEEEVPSSFVQGPSEISILDPTNPVKELKHHRSVTKIAMKEEKLLACVSANQTVVVWDLPSATQIVTFNLVSHGVHVAWHSSEPYKLMVVEQNGWVKFFNVFKQSCFMTFYTSRFPLYCADWATTNSLLAVVGWPGGFTIINTSQSNSNMHKNFEVPQNSFSCVKFGTSDDKMVATFTTSPERVVRLWKQSFMTHMWSHNSTTIRDIAWVHGKPFILGLGHGKLYIYEASDF